LRRVAKKSHEIYDVLPVYHRFDQKYNMTRRTKWDWRDFGERTRKNRNTRMQKGVSGYGLKDVALWQASQSSLTIAHSGLHTPNRGHTSWHKVTGKVPSDQERPNLDTSQLRGLVSRVAHLFGADLMGVTRLDRRWIYSHYFDEKQEQSFPILFSDEVEGDFKAPTVLDDGTQVIPAEMDTVLVMVMAMDPAGVACAPTMTHRASVRLTYARLGFLTLGVAEFIRGIGYHAIPMLNETGLSVPLAIDAGLGQLGRHGLLINPRYGSGCRICKVLTDMPLEQDWPIDFGVTAFCDVCKKCAVHCPGGAISHGPRSHRAATISNNPGALKWEFDAEKCRQYNMRVATNCGICLRVCPFTKSQHWIHNMVRGLISKFPCMDPFIVKLDDVLGYGKFKDPEYHFW